MKKEIFNIFPTTIYVSEVENHSEIKKEFYKLYSKYDYNQKSFRDNEEWFNGMVGLSVPITNNNSLYFCLSTHTAKSRKNIEDLRKILPLMLNASGNLKKILFKE